MFDRKRISKMFVAEPRPCTWMASLRFYCCCLLVLSAVSNAQPSARFTQSMYTFDVLEEQPIGTAVDRVEAVTLFGTPVIGGTYSISDQQDFTINATTGVISTATVFDRDAAGAVLQYSIMAQFTTADGLNTITASVVITIQDINDNPPVFTQPSFMVELVEKTAPGTEFFNVTATDADLLFTERDSMVQPDGTTILGPIRYLVINGRITYSIIEGNELGHFRINNETGALSVAPGADLDVDATTQYNLTVMIVDGGGLNDTADVTIFILDANDNAPVITYPVNYSITIQEDAPVGLVILDGINATDIDFNNNSQIRFFIVGGDQSDRLQINSTSGEVLVASRLDRELSSSLIITIAARDLGSPPLEDTIDIIIILEDVNDYVPTFINLPYVGSVTEELLSIVSVVTVEAMDLDEGPEGVVNYSIVWQSSGQFSIDAITGELQTNGTLDREEAAIVTVTVRAYDNPVNQSLRLSSEVNVTINVLDINDNVPTFGVDVLTAGVLDTATLGTVVTTLHATDDDAGSNAEIRYQKISGDTTFVIMDNGTVVVNDTLHFETQYLYSYTVRALDSGLSSRSSEAPFNIQIHNVNENTPRFRRRIFSVNLTENATVGIVILQVNATDRDTGLTGLVRYRVNTVFDAAGSFDVNATTGEVFINTTLDYDVKDTIFFQVEAYDGGFPEPRTDLANVTIYLSDVNDRPPDFLFAPDYQAVVVENALPGIIVVNLSDFTTDVDTGVGGLFNLTIVENSYFLFDHATNIITSNATFDRESVNSYIVTILAMDFGNPRLNSSYDLTIAVGDMNDNAPFYTLNTSGTVIEFNPIGTEIISEYRAEDMDIGINAELTYNIFSGDPLGRFAINQTTGKIATAQILNKTDQEFYELTIIVTDGGIPEMCGFGYVNITVLDFNDNLPVFAGDVLQASVTESAEVGDSFYTVEAMDDDLGSNAVLEYFIVEDTLNISQRFTINQTSGELYTNDTFDRETEYQLNITVVAIDNGLIPLSASAIVMITILDSNDFHPVFNSTNFTASVIENAEIDTFVLEVFATDEDVDFENRNFSYAIFGNGSEAFRMDPLSGGLFVAGEVDWEYGDYEFTVHCSDNGAPPLTNESTIFVTVIDVNDRVPQFTEESYQLAVPEGMPVGTTVGYLVADDFDSPGNNSDVLYYKLMELSLPNMDRFIVDSMTGLVTTNRIFNFESRRSFDLLVRAIDQGDPPLMNDTMITITILDGNDQYPVFDQDVYEADIPEDIRNNTVILVMRATDGDVGSNSELRYFINSTDFYVNSTTGLLYTAVETFDREDVDRFEFTATVSDLGIPPRSDQTMIIINIIDVNDNYPIFSQPSYAASLEENLAIGTVVTALIATDEDLGVDGVIEYLFDDVPGSENFGIDNRTGVIHTIRYIDREVYPHVSLVVIANNSLSSRVFHSNVTVNITVTDLNDQHPSFSRTYIDIYIPENVTIGSAVYNVTAVDLDLGTGGEVSYAIIAGNGERVFMLDATGVLSINETLDYETKSLYSIAVQACDNGPETLCNYTTYLIYVVDSNDNVPQFALSQYQITISFGIISGSNVSKLELLDIDTNPVEYFIEADNSSGLFRISNDGTIQTTSSITSLRERTVLLTVRAFDGLYNATADILIHVVGSIDVQFIPQTFTCQFTENSVHPATPCVTVLNHDSLVIAAENSPGLFAIDNSGRVSVLMSLNYENRSVYQLVVEASNTMGEVAYAVVTIMVVDINEFAPNFVTDSYYVVLPETYGVGRTFLKVAAIDDDGTPLNNDVTYQIVMQSPVNDFAINSETGELRVSQQLDYEYDVRRGLFRREYDLSVMATNDAGGLVFTDTVNIHINITDDNDNLPVFNAFVYNIQIPENVTVGIQIEHMFTVSDNDRGSNAEITYGLTGDHKYTDFTVNTSTGEVYLSRSLDAERQSSYTLELHASDRGNPGNDETASISILVQDLNDNEPIWESGLYSVILSEHVPLNTTIIEVQATDADQIATSTSSGRIIYLNRNGLITYSITAGDPLNQFSINNVTGAITIVRSLNREINASYNLTLNATDGGGRYTNSYFYIQLIDENDNIPLFTETIYNVSIVENSEPGINITRVKANDLDIGNNGNITYAIISGNIDDTFWINATTGDIFLMGNVDREDIEIYLLVVEAMDYGLVQLTSTAIVNITVIDVNEFPPVFTEFQYATEIYENHSIGNLVLTVSTTDADSGLNSLITYSIIAGNELQHFHIDAYTGEIIVSRELDYEDTTGYELEIYATDNGDIVETRLNSTVNVTISILDVNDNTPEFMNSSYIADVLENATAGTEIITLPTTDADSGENQEVQYSLHFASGDTESPNNFGIDPDDGTVYLLNTAVLDRETFTEYEFIVIVTDNGTSSLASNITLKIIIIDVNDNAPVFQSSFFVGDIYENLPANTSVISVNATDIDEGQNSQIMYFLDNVILLPNNCNDLCVQDTCNDLLSGSNTSLNSDFSLFDIDEITGEIISTEEFDRENISDYLLLIEAEDQGIPTQFSYACVHVRILDQSDNAPFFAQSVYAAQVAENANYSEVIQLTADDIDIGNNAVLAYSIIDPYNVFAVDPLNATIFTIRPLDREIQDVYNVTIIVSDGGIPSLQNMTIVSIAIEDLNDNAPEFTEALYRIQVAENVSVGTLVGNVYATDNDIGTNSYVTYMLDTSSINVNHFTINSTSGGIYTVQLLDYENIQLYNITVIATDTGSVPLSTTATVVIDVMDINDNPPVFVNLPYVASLDENLNEPVLLLSVDAIDNDSGPNAEIIYTISTISPPNDAFSIDTVSGDTLAVEAVDAEYSLEYTITVDAINSNGEPLLLSSINITISVNDINDIVPVFDSPSYTIPISESILVGSFVFQVTANDLDVTEVNSNLTYQLTADYNTTALFSIELYTGIIRTTGELDRETSDLHYLNVTCYDISNFTDITIVTVYVQDSNDNAPIFEQPKYSFSFYEDTLVGALIGRVIANDADLENISYFISQNSSLLFTVDALTGELFTNGTFDREEMDTHVIFVVATDNGNATSRETAVEVEFTILDINDENPVFNESFYEAFWDEEITAIDTNLITVSAYDNDIGVNSEISYAIMPGRDSSHFSINSTTGEIYLRDNFDREIQDLFSIIVIATDAGTPPLTGDVNVSILVLDINDNYPIFNQSNYTAVLLENTAAGTEFLTINSTDIDIDENAEVIYSIVDNFNDTFAIDNVTGVVSLTGDIDYEQVQSYELNITASDGGNVSLVSSVMVSITIVDLNDNPPILNSSVYYITISENSIPGTPVFEIPATDEDSTTNGRLRYYTTSGNNENKFTLDEDTGVYFVADYLDREITGSYSIAFTVVDLGPVSFSISATLEIEIQDINDNAPIFDSRLYEVTVSEASRVRQVVYSFNAVDNDVGNNANLTYSIIGGNVDNAFTVDPSANTLIVATSLDYEQRQSYTLSILVADDSRPQLTDTTNVHVIVTDYNEFPPTFQQSQYQIDIPVSTVVGTPVTHLRAIDDDAFSPSTIAYSIVDGNSASLFSIAVSGTIHTHSSLLGMEGTHELMIEASDGVQRSICQVIINILLASSTMPLFQPPAQLIHVPENVNPSTIIANITTIPSDAQLSIYLNDSDIARNESMTIETLFQISSDGRLQVTGSLDREEFSVYVIPLQATMLLSTTSFATVTVIVTDVNDNPPVSDSLSYNVSLSESTAILSPVLTIFASDYDIFENSEFEFSITSGNENRFFMLDSFTGELITIMSLDRELEANPCLQVVIRNHRSPETLYSQAKINIMIQDVNDNSPEFSESFYQYTITDDTAVGSFVGQPDASDQDQGSNSELLYFIFHQTEPGSFEINQTTGEIYVNMILDSRNISQHILTLVVTDRGTPIPRRASTIAFVDVLPVNNFTPEFLQPVYNISIPETLGIGALVLTVEANDPDFSDDDQVIEYEILSGNEADSFVIERTTGNIFLRQSLDFLVQSNFTLTVAAFDMGTPVLNSSVDVEITVEDINTHPPIFEMSQYAVSVFENISVGTSLINVTATDIDAVEILYFLTVNAEVNGYPLFNIDQRSGELSVAYTLDREVSDKYELMVSAIDTGYPIVISRTVQVIVTLLDVNDNAPVFNQSNQLNITRLLPPQQPVFQVNIFDVDLLSQFSYSIISGNDDELFDIDSETGLIVTNVTIPEVGVDSYELLILVDDGNFNSTSTVTIYLSHNGTFCEGDLCTNVTARQGMCPEGFVPTPMGQHCWSLYCTSNDYRPCNDTRSCVLRDRSCVSSCPNGMSLCPTTDTCLVTPTQQMSATCDGSNETCLVGQTLYQNVSGNRYCIATTMLPSSQRNCTGLGVVFCELLNDCSNLTAPHLCMHCPSHLVYCNDTRVCVDDNKRCCGISGYFCDILNTCLSIGDTCKLPNVAPEIDRDLILLEEVTLFDSASVYSSIGHVISLLLSRNNTLAVDIQGEELGIAVTGVSDVNPEFGQWQYSLCRDSSMDSYGDCSVMTTGWLDINASVNNTNALFIPNNARIRFVRRSVEVEGAVWIRAKLWDGNPDGFISSESDLVRNQTPHYNATIPFSSNSAISELSTLITVLFIPVVVAPQFSPNASLTLDTISEEERFVDNNGNTIEELILSIYLPPPVILSTESILGFPSPPSGSPITSYQNQLSPEIVDRYFTAVSAVNHVRIAYADAIMSDQLPGVGLSHDPISNATGRWQVSLDSSLINWIYLDTIIADSSQYILLDTSVRLRFVPAVDYYGEASIRIRPWDGIYDNRLVTINGDFVIVMDNVVPSSVSSLGVNEWQTASVNILQVMDRPIASETVVYLDPIPYFITYKYDKLFTVQIDREVDTVRANRDTLENYLQVVFIAAVNILRIVPAQNNRCLVSFTVEQNTLSLSDVKEHLMERDSSLEALGYPILEVSQDASYGTNYGCTGSDPLPHYGVQVNEFVTRFARDGDEDFLGLAVIAINSTNQGTWQYYRANVTDYNEDYNNSSVVPIGYQPSKIPWVNFPPNIAENNAFLLQGIDRLRFVPRPNYYWLNSTNTSPLITIKIWDGSTVSRSTSSSELDLMNINTNPYKDTLQSVVNSVGLFSLEKVSVYATRYGCDEVINSAMTFDACCTCGGNGGSCAGCNGVQNSNTAFDSCDTCEGNDLTCLGCDFIPYSDSSAGACGECIGEAEIDRGISEGSSFTIVMTADFMDCAGVCYGPALIDQCSNCSGGNTTRNYNEEKDCAGVCFGPAVIDDCGYCTGVGTSLMYNELLDCTGVCDGPFRDDSCGVCQRPDDSGHIVEHRDCNGICFGTALLDSCELCYGGGTNNTANLGLDACDVCFGDNSTCIGCDGTVDSGLVVDTCGECSNNSCGCFKIDSISPNRGPSTGSTQIIVQGAGFFLNDDSLTEYNPQAPNCGAPTSFSSGDIILPRCYFRTSTQQFSSIGLLINHTTILCTTADTTGAERSPTYNLHIGIHDGPLTPATPSAIFYNDDYSNVLITEMIPTWNVLGSRTTLSYVGHNFSDTGFVSCIIYGLENCLFDSTETMEVYSATLISSTRVYCDLPPVDIPCQTTIRLSFDGQPSGQAIPTAPNLDFTFTFYATAPVVTQAYFSDDMSSMFLQFDKQIELIGITLSCGNVFSATTNSVLGTSPACIWSSSSFDKIAILLPADAQVTRFTPIEFKDDIIRAYGQLYSRNITNYSVQAGGGTKPVAIIEGPDNIPLCGTVTFTGRQSLYSGYGGFNYTWSVSVLDSTTSRFNEIQNYINRLTPQDDAIVLNTVHFVSNLEYYLQLTVTNSIGLVSDTRSWRLIKQGSPVPQIQLVGDRRNRILCGSSTLFQVEVDSLPCSGLSGDITYQWSLFEVEKSKRMSLIIQDTSSLRVDSPTLYIPSSLFQCNYTYVAMVTATIGSASDSNNFTIDVQPVTLRAHIHGGNRTVARHRSLILDATRSITIPDAGSVSYIWSCTNVNTGEPCYDVTIGNTSIVNFDDADYINIPADSFALDTFYLIQLTVKQGVSVSTETVWIQFVDMTPPVVEIVVPVNEAFVVTDRIILEGLVFSVQPTSRVFWQCIEIPGQTCVDLNDNSIAELQITYESLGASMIDSTTDLTQQYIESDQVNRVRLVLSPNVLTAGFKYTFRLTADNLLGQGYSEITIIPSPEPTTGNVDIQPMTGTSLSTLFTITCTAASTSEQAQPMEYQYGIVTRLTGGVNDLSEGDVQWLTGRLKTEQHTTLLPGNNRDSNINIVVRVTDRYDAYTDLFGMVTVQFTATNYMTVLTGIVSREQEDKAWTTALSSITALLVQIDQTSTSPLRNVKRNALSAALDIYENSLVATKNHLIHFVSLLSYITGDSQVVTNDIGRTLAAMDAIINDLVSYDSAVSQNTDVPLSNDEEPLTLASGSSPIVQNYNALTEYEANLIFSVWNDLISAGSSSGAQFRNAVDKISLNLCQSKLQGESTTTLQSSVSHLQILKSLPYGAITLTSGIVLIVNSTIVNYYTNNLCTRTTGCEDVCTVIATTEDDVLAVNSATNPNSKVLQLSTRSINMINNNIMYVDTMEIQPYSRIMSFSLLAPARSQILEISDLSAPYSVQLPLKSNSIPSGTQLLCLYRRPGDSSWQLDSTTSPETIEINGTSYAVCRYDHLTDFIVALLPAPVTPSPTPSPTPTSTSTTMTPSSTSTSSSVSVSTPSLVAPPGGGGGGGAGGAIAAVVVIILLLAVTITVIIIIIIWRKKRQKRRVDIAKVPPNGLELQENAELVKAALLTPEEAKIPMQIIKISEGGQKERELLGTLNVLPQIRLRELRNQLFDNFETLKNKPFYFLTKQLCDIEPAAEQMQFVNLVYDKTIFIREAESNTERSRRHFCTCGLAAQFECSQCTAQGYCSPECQYKHWTEEHSKECRRLAERKRRTNILTRHQSPTSISPLSPLGELPPVQAGSLAQQGKRFSLSSIDASDAPASPPKDFRSLLMAQKASRMSLSSNRTSLGDIASQGPNSLSRTSGIGIPHQRPTQQQPHSIFTTPKLSSPGQPVAVFDRSSTTKNVNPELLLSSKPLGATTAASTPITAATISQQQGLMMRGLSDSSMQTPQATQPTPIQPRTTSTTSAGALSLSQPASMLRHQPNMTSEQLDQSFTSQNLPPTPQTADEQQVFVRKKLPTQVTPRVMSRMTVQSILSQDLDASGRYNNVRDEPLLESDEDEYEETSSSGSDASDDDNISNSRPVSKKPPSLARRSITTASRAERKASSTESSSGSEEEESDSETETDSEDDDQSKLVQEKPQKSVTPSKAKTEQKTTVRHGSETDELKDDKRLIKDQDDKELTSDEDASRV